MFTNESGPLCGNREPNPEKKLNLYSNCSAFSQNRKPFFETLSGRYYRILWQPFMMPDEKIIYRVGGGGGSDGWR